VSRKARCNFRVVSPHRGSQGQGQRGFLHKAGWQQVKISATVHPVSLAVLRCPTVCWSSSMSKPYSFLPPCDSNCGARPKPVDGLAARRFANTTRRERWADPFRPSAQALIPSLPEDSLRQLKIRVSRRMCAKQRPCRAREGFIASHAALFLNWNKSRSNTVYSNSITGRDFYRIRARQRGSSPAYLICGHQDWRSRTCKTRQAVPWFRQRAVHRFFGLCIAQPAQVVASTSLCSATPASNHAVAL